VDARGKRGHDELLIPSKRNLLYRTTPEMKPGLRRGGLTWSFRKQRAERAM